MSKMVLDDWQRGRLPYFVNPDEAFDKYNRGEDIMKGATYDKTSNASDPKLAAIHEKRMELESKLKLENQDFKQLKEKEFSSETFNNQEDGEEDPEDQMEDENQNSDDQNSEDNDEDDNEVLQMDDKVVPIDANDDAAAELERLNKKLQMYKRKNKVLDSATNRLAVVEAVKKQTFYKASIEAAYGAKKHAKEDKRRNIDVLESEKKARKMSRMITGDVDRSGRPEKKSKSSPSDNG